MDIYVQVPDLNLPFPSKVLTLIIGSKNQRGNSEGAVADRLGRTRPLGVRREGGVLKCSETL